MKHLLRILLGSYFIGTFAYVIDGASVRSSAYCQDDRMVVIYELTASDTLERRYLAFPPNATADYDISHTGVVMVEGVELIWLRHRVGDRATLTVSGGVCTPAPHHLSPRHRLFAPTVMF